MRRTVLSLAIAATASLAYAVPALAVAPTAPTAPRGGIGNAFRTSVPAAVRVTVPSGARCVRAGRLVVDVRLARGARLFSLTADVNDRPVRVPRRAGRIELRVPRHGSFNVLVTATVRRHGRSIQREGIGFYRACARA